MNEHDSNSKRIVTNTFVLYVRMVIVMSIMLYASRIVLEALGVDDFGLYNVVGGVVALLSFLRTSLTSSTQRFLSYELGRKDKDKLKTVFGNSMTAHILISLIILVSAETVGLWFLNAKINIPEGRRIAANVIYQLSVLSTILNMITVPFNAAVISHEKMSYFALVGVFDAVLKLGSALLLLFLGTDKLILYGVLMTIISFFDLFAYWLYCRVKFDEARFRLTYDSGMFKEIFGFSGWTILGQMAIIGVNYGTNILVNLFYSVAANAAMGIAQQVNGAIMGLTNNFQTAFQPQITKSYASGDIDYMNTLVIYASKISFFLLFIVTYPIMLNIDYILDLWLTTVPQYSNSFSIFFMIASIFTALSTPLWISIFATGHIKRYQIAVSAAYFSDLIIVYVLFRIGLPPITCMIVKAVVNFCVIFVRLFYAKKEVVGFSAVKYLCLAFTPCMVSAIFIIATTMPFYFKASTVGQKVAGTTFAIIVSLIIVYFIGLKKDERKALKKLALSVIHREK